MFIYLCVAIKIEADLFFYIDTFVNFDMVAIPLFAIPQPVLLVVNVFPLPPVDQLDHIIQPAQEF